jgi:hypothetical protein
MVAVATGFLQAGASTPLYIVRRHKRNKRNV